MRKSILVMFFLVSYGQIQSQKNNLVPQEKNNTKNNFSEANPKTFDSSIIKQIVEYYKKDNKENKMKTENSDSTLTLTFYEKPENKEDIEHFLLTVYIPKIKSDYLIGDLNKDGVSDIVVSVPTEGGGGGGNIWWNDIFVFISDRKKYMLSAYRQSPEICGCKDGYFYPEKIENGLIKGTSLCYNWEQDAHCCPSLKYNTVIKYEKKKLIFQNKKQLDKMQGK